MTFCPSCLYHTGYDYCNNNPLNVTDRYGEFLPFLFGVAVGMWLADMMESIEDVKTAFESGGKDAGSYAGGPSSVVSGTSAVLRGQAETLSQYDYDRYGKTVKGMKTGAAALTVGAGAVSSLMIWADPNLNLKGKMMLTTRQAITTGATLVGGGIGVVGGGILGTLMMSPGLGSGVGAVMGAYYGAGFVEGKVGELLGTVGLNYTNRSFYEQVSNNQV